jgi:hypothetical protein
MIHNSKPYCCFLIATFFFASHLHAQKGSGYLFIEPNISLSFDSTKFKIGKRYSNTTYETESYDFTTAFDTANRVLIQVSAKHPLGGSMSTKKLEDAMNDRIKAFLKVKDSRVVLVDYDKKARRVADFVCAGFVLLDKKTKKAATRIVCNHISESDLTEVMLLSMHRKSLVDDYKILEQLLQGFSAYSKARIHKEDSLIKAQYTINVLQAKDTVMYGFKRQPPVYFAVVTTNEPLQHRVKEATLDLKFGKQIFSPNENGEVYITFSDSEKGTIKKTGELVMLNSFGKKVKIPFSFTYENR